MNDLDVFHPVRRLRVAGRDVTVRELAWPDALELLARLSRHAASGSALASPPLPPDAPASSPGAGPAMRPGAAGLLAVAANAGEDLIGFLLARGTDLPPDAVRRLPAGAAFQLGAAALELTLNDEVIAAGKTVAGRLRQAFGPPPPPSRPSSTFSSPAGTPIPGATPSGS